MICLSHPLPICPTDAPDHDQRRTPSFFESQDRPTNQTTNENHNLIRTRIAPSLIIASEHAYRNARYPLTPAKMLSPRTRTDTRYISRRPLSPEALLLSPFHGCPRPNSRAACVSCAACVSLEPRNYLSSCSFDLISYPCVTCVSRGSPSHCDASSQTSPCTTHKDNTHARPHHCQIKSHGPPHSRHRNRPNFLTARIRRRHARLVAHHLSTPLQSPGSYSYYRASISRLIIHHLQNMLFGHCLPPHTEKCRHSRPHRKRKKTKAPPLSTQSQYLSALGLSESDYDLINHVKFLDPEACPLLSAPQTLACRAYTTNLNIVASAHFTPSTC